jgi:hypothetical protein
MWKIIWKMFLKDFKSFHRKPLDNPRGMLYNSNPRPEDERSAERRRNRPKEREMLETMYGVRFAKAR